MRILGALLWLTTFANAQQFNTQTSLVQINVTVRDRNDHFIETLHPADFRLAEDGSPRPLAHVSLVSGPISLGIVLDVSSSMRGKLSDALRALDVLDDILTPGDEGFLIPFRDQPLTPTGWTQDFQQIRSVAATQEAHGKTALYDAIYAAFGQLRRASNPRRSLLILSDGLDTASRLHCRELRTIARETDVTVYAILLQGWLEDPYPAGLASITEETGGDLRLGFTAKDFPKLITRLPFKREYLLEFTPAFAPRDGKYHPVKVSLNSKQKYKLSWRRGYYAADPETVQ